MSDNIVYINQASFIKKENASLALIDQAIFACEMVGQINKTSTWTNRQAEDVGLNAFERAKVRTFFGQSAKQHPWMHLEQVRSGCGDIYSEEKNFMPDIWEIILSDKFIDTCNSLPDRGGVRYGWQSANNQIQIYKTEVLHFLTYILSNKAKTVLEWDNAKVKIKEIEEISRVIDNNLQVRITSLINIGKQLNAQ